MFAASAARTHERLQLRPARHEVRDRPDEDVPHPRAPRREHERGRERRIRREEDGGADVRIPEPRAECVADDRERSEQQQAGREPGGLYVRVGGRAGMLCDHPCSATIVRGRTRLRRCDFGPTCVVALLPGWSSMADPGLLSSIWAVECAESARRLRETFDRRGRRGAAERAENDGTPDCRWFL